MPESPRSVPPFFKRFALLPFLPRLWAEARGWDVSAVLLPLLLISVVLSGGLGAYRGWELLGELRKGADKFDQSWDPVVIQDGVVRVEGSRLLRIDPEDQSHGLIMVDPGETVPDADLPNKSMVLRQHVFVTVESGLHKEIPVKDAMSFLGLGDVRVDGAAIRSWCDRSGGWVVSGLALFMLLVSLIGDGVGCTLAALVAGAILLAVRGSALRYDFGKCFRICLAALTIKPVVGTLLPLLAKTSVGFCMGLWIWPTAAVVLALVALRKERPPVSPTPAAPPPLTPQPGF